MALVTDRATIEEKAFAWDHLMRATGDDSEAIQAAWEYLSNMVENREDGPLDRNTGPMPTGTD